MSDFQETGTNGGNLHASRVGIVGNPGPSTWLLKVQTDTDVNLDAARFRRFVAFGESLPGFARSEGEGTAVAIDWFKAQAELEKSRATEERDRANENWKQRDAYRAESAARQEQNERLAKNLTEAKAEVERLRSELGSAHANAANWQGAVTELETDHAEAMAKIQSECNVLRRLMTEPKPFGSRLAKIRAEHGLLVGAALENLFAALEVENQADIESVPDPETLGRLNFEAQSNEPASNWPSVAPMGIYQKSGVAFWNLLVAHGAKPPMPQTEKAERENYVATLRGCLDGVCVALRLPGTPDFRSLPDLVLAIQERAEKAERDLLARNAPLRDRALTVAFLRAMGMTESADAIDRGLHWVGEKADDGAEAANAGTARLQADVRALRFELLGANELAKARLGIIDAVKIALGGDPLHDAVDLASAIEEALTKSNAEADGLKIAAREMERQRDAETVRADSTRDTLHVYIAKVAALKGLLDAAEKFRKADARALRTGEGLSTRFLDEARAALFAALCAAFSGSVDAVPKVAASPGLRAAAERFAEHWRTRGVDWIGEPADVLCAALDSEPEVTARDLRLSDGSGTPFPVRECLRVLAAAADHLLADHNCDEDGHEVTSEARDAARRLLAVETVDHTHAPEDAGHPHLIGDEFQSDKYPTCPRGKVPLSCKDPAAQDLLWTYAERRQPVDAEFAADLKIALRTQGYEPRPSAEALAPAPDAATFARALWEQDAGPTPLPWDAVGGPLRQRYVQIAQTCTRALGGGKAHAEDRPSGYNPNHDPNGEALRRWREDRTPIGRVRLAAVAVVQQLANDNDEAPMLRANWSSAAADAVEALAAALGAVDG